MQAKQPLSPRPWYQSIAFWREDVTVPVDQLQLSCERLGVPPEMVDKLIADPDARDAVAALFHGPRPLASVIVEPGSAPIVVCGQPEALAPLTTLGEGMLALRLPCAVVPLLAACRLGAGCDREAMPARLAACVEALGNAAAVADHGQLDALCRDTLSLLQGRHVSAALAERLLIACELRGMWSEHGGWLQCAVIEAKLENLPALGVRAIQKTVAACLSDIDRGLDKARARDDEALLRKSLDVLVRLDLALGHGHPPVRARILTLKEGLHAQYDQRRAVDQALIHRDALALQPGAPEIDLQDAERRCLEAEAALKGGLPFWILKQRCESLTGRQGGPELLHLAALRLQSDPEDSAAAFESALSTLETMATEEHALWGDVITLLDTLGAWAPAERGLAHLERLEALLHRRRALAQPGEPANQGVMGMVPLALVQARCALLHRLAPEHTDLMVEQLEGLLIRHASARHWPSVVRRLLPLVVQCANPRVLSMLRNGLEQQPVPGLEGVSPMLESLQILLEGGDVNACSDLLPAAAKAFPVLLMTGGGDVARQCLRALHTAVLGWGESVRSERDLDACIHWLMQPLSMPAFDHTIAPREHVVACLGEAAEVAVRSGHGERVRALYQALRSRLGQELTVEVEPSSAEWRAALSCATLANVLGKPIDLELEKLRHDRDTSARPIVNIENLLRLVCEAVRLRMQGDVLGMLMPLRDADKMQWQLTWYSDLEYTRFPDDSYDRRVKSILKALTPTVTEGPLDANFREDEL